MKLWFEKLYPYIFGVIASTLWYELALKFPSSDSVLSSTLTVSGVFVGFLSTSKAILMSMSSPILEDLKSSGYIEELVSYIGQAIWVNLIFCGINVSGYFVDTASIWYSVVWIGIAICALTTFVRVTHIMLKVFKFG